VIGVYTGAEDNMFWRRLGDAPGRIVHSVTNPIPRLTGAIHVYGGDFFAVQRSEWDPLRLCERPYDVAKNMRLFAEANARCTAAPEG
jgi:predicted metal-dependent enzyme (double-stranded beta helix superfamily)